MKTKQIYWPVKLPGPSRNGPLVFSPSQHIYFPKSMNIALHVGFCKRGVVMQIDRFQDTVLEVSLTEFSSPQEFFFIFRFSQYPNKPQQ